MLTELFGMEKQSFKCFKNHEQAKCPSIENGKIHCSILTVRHYLALKNK